MTSIEDRLAISDLLTRYATALDSRDWDLLRTVFVEDAQVRYAGGPLLNGFEETWRFCDRALSRYRATQHLLGNADIHVSGDAGTSTVYLQAIHIQPDGVIFTLGGAYYDKLVRTVDGWRIAERTLESWWTEWGDVDGAVRP